MVVKIDRRTWAEKFREFNNKRMRKHQRPFNRTKWLMRYGVSR